MEGASECLLTYCTLGSKKTQLLHIGTICSHTWSTSSGEQLFLSLNQIVFRANEFHYSFQMAVEPKETPVGRKDGCRESLQCSAECRLAFMTKLCQINHVTGWMLPCHWLRSGCFCISSDPSLVAYRHPARQGLLLHKLSPSCILCPLSSTASRTLLKSIAWPMT